ncbi:BTAD domain-containing putative transcriptional regulator [Streptomyces sp. NPDC057136]|uniref:BTAD domain-containing putative transcriptional regulator n=1 Tax=Streptomyces sp. NPDC057136 TaxID=3346029 RepID=UPI00363C18DA
MPIVLTLLNGVRWRGEAVVGERPQALLAALASGTTVRAERLIEAVWADNEPATPGKALQVLVSRTRAACGPESIVRDGNGYRLGLGPHQIDSLVVRSETAAARGALTGDPTQAAEHARAALALADGLAIVGDVTGPLADVRREAARNLRTARTVLAQSASRSGSHNEALPELEEALAAQADDEALLADLLRSLAAVRGAAAALNRFETYRSALRDRLGTDPGPELRRLHHELLSRDSPVRDGLHYEATALLGRADDVRRLCAAMVASRVVSILGPGGLGKTRLAHVLGRSAAQPVVHFVELVGVTAPEDLVGEVGSALGVRDSVSGRRALTPEQRADVRARIAHHLDQAPSLLILDNCEHIVGSVADLVAYLVTTTREVRVLTTTRAPLAIAAERVYPLDALRAEDAGELFAQRAVAARPDVVLDEGAVADIVGHLDGLPLAIELAAAKVRVMSTPDIARRLENRFALLRGGDRSAPDRHQTLLAVIDWSWNLLADTEKRALRWLSVFHDGFTLDAAERVLGPDALDAVQSLVNQSLLTVLESGAGVRYRMLETVREFGRMQLVDVGEDEVAQAAHRAWAVEYAALHVPRLFGPDQFEVVDAIRVEEMNLADVLRQALAAPDPETVVQVLAALGTYWSILGSHGRVIVLVDAVAHTISSWTPSPEIAEMARIALVMTLSNAMIVVEETAEPIRALLRKLGPGDEPRVAGMVRVLTGFSQGDEDEFVRRLEEFTASDDRHIAGLAWQWRSYGLENAGDPEGAVTAAERALALCRESDGLWSAAILHTQLTQLDMQLGRVPSAVVHARAALPVLLRLGASDDILQLRALLALAAIHEGDLDHARQEGARMSEAENSEHIFAGQLAIDMGRAELALASGDHDTGLALYRAAVDRVRGLRFPGIPTTGLEPWLLNCEGITLAAHARYSGPEHEEYATALFRSCLDRSRRVLDPAYDRLDYPVTGIVLFALGAWGLLRDALPEQDAVRLLVYADRFAYNRSVPTMAWERITPYAEEKATGRLAALQHELGERRGPELRDEALRFVKKLE